MLLQMQTVLMHMIMIHSMIVGYLGGDWGGDSRLAWLVEKKSMPRACVNNIVAWDNGDEHSVVFHSSHGSLNCYSSYSDIEISLQTVNLSP